MKEAPPRLYPVEFEIAGPAAMFARPDTGSTPISYPAPTWSACKAMFESVARGIFHEKRALGERVEPAAFLCPTEVEIWRPIRFEKFVTNYRGPLRKDQEIKKGNSYQLAATVLVDVCYRVKGICLPVPGTSTSKINSAHALQEIFVRRLQQGKSKYSPSLGWKEFFPSYFGPFKDHLPDDSNAPHLQTEVDDQLIPAFLLSVWNAPVNGRYAPIFREQRICKGKVTFPEVEIENGKFRFRESDNAK